MNISIYILGDTHGNWTPLLSRINYFDIRDCTIIHVGDIGLGFKDFDDQEEELEKTASWNIPLGGLAIWVQFQPEISLVKLAEEANKIDLFLPKIILYQDKKTCAIRFGFGHLNEDEIAPVIKKLKSAYNKVTIKRF